MKRPSTPKQRPKPLQRILDLIMNAKARRAEKRNAKVSANPVLVRETQPGKD